MVEHLSPIVIFQQNFVDKQSCFTPTLKYSDPGQFNLHFFLHIQIRQVGHRATQINQIKRRDTIRLLGWCVHASSIILQK